MNESPLHRGTLKVLPNVNSLPSTPSKTQQGLYQAPGPSPQFQSPPAKQTSAFSKQMPHHPFPSPAPDLYQVPPGPGSPAQDVDQVPPSMDARHWEGTKPPAKVRPPGRSGGPSRGSRPGLITGRSRAQPVIFGTTGVPVVAPCLVWGHGGR